MNKALSDMPESLKFFMNCLYAAFAGAIIMSVATVISSFILTYTENPEGFYLVCLIAARALCGIFAGCIAIRKTRRYALVCGMLTSAFIMGILFLTSLFIPRCEVTAAWWQTILIPLCTISSTVILNKE